MRLRFLAAAGLLVASMAAHADTIQTTTYTYSGTVTASGADFTYYPDQTYIFSSYTNTSVPAFVTLREIFSTVNGIGGYSQFVGESLAVFTPKHVFGPPTLELYLEHDNCSGLGSDCVYFDFDPDGYVGPLPAPKLYFSGGLSDLLFYPDTGTEYGDSVDFHGDLSLVRADAPEPSSFALLGTGLLGAAGVIRKRLA